MAFPSEPAADLPATQRAVFRAVELHADLYGSAAGGLTLQLEHHGKLLTGAWHGWLKTDLVLQGARAVWRALLHCNCPLALNDASGIVGGEWTELLPWLQYDYFPRLTTAGLRRMACVQPPDLATRLTLQALAAGAVGILEIALFETTADARQWLLAENHLINVPPGW